ncbi:MAG TPA: substrate-binding domain-containing protein, partial [Novosphingobium sp.]|nr:substrate-binding domain-containing protein [Novosphingobium sp.]
DELLAYRLDGVILASSSRAARVARECLEGGVPVVMLNNVDPEGRIPGVCTDAEAGTRAIAGHLLASGRRRIGLVSGLEESSTSVERSAAFTRAIAEHPEACLFTACGQFSAEGAYAAARKLLSLRQPVEALFCVTDFMALSALEAVRDMGLEPGCEVAVFGFDDVPVGRRPAFALATYAQPLEAMVDATLEMLYAQIEGQPLADGIRRLEGQLVLRQSGGQIPPAGG